MGTDIYFYLVRPLNDKELSELPEEVVTDKDMPDGSGINYNDYNPRPFKWETQIGVKRTYRFKFVDKRAAFLKMTGKNASSIWYDWQMDIAHVKVEGEDDEIEVPQKEFDKYLETREREILVYHQELVSKVGGSYKLDTDGYTDVLLTPNDLLNLGKRLYDSGDLGDGEDSYYGTAIIPLMQAYYTAKQKNANIVISLA